VKNTSYAYELLQKGKRLDGRRFDEFRKIEMQTGVVNKAEGSALVKLGNTQVIAGVKLNVGSPFPDSPEEGVLIVNSEFTPLASPDFEAGPPGEDAIELSRIVDRGIREAKAIDMGKLFIEQEKVWTVFIDIHILNHDGNLVDAAALASVAALHNTRIPKYENGEVIRGEYERKLPVVNKPITVTVCKFSGQLLVDPVLEEEKVIDSKLTVATLDNGYLCAMQKQGEKSLTLQDVEKIIELAFQKGDELRKLI
jgi:exosome complex component RRP42